LRQTTGFVESLLCLIGLDWDVSGLSKLNRRQKTLAVTIPHRRAQGALLYDSPTSQPFLWIACRRSYE
jgi:hypothetical protein